MPFAGPVKGTLSTARELDAFEMAETQQASGIRHQGHEAACLHVTLRLSACCLRLFLEAVDIMQVML